MSGEVFRFELTGVKELMKLLDQLPTVAMQKTVVRNALKKSAQPIADLAKAHAPYDPDNHDGKHLRDSITVSTSLKASQKRGRLRDKTAVEVFVGSSAPHAHLIEFGTAARYDKTRKGAYRGFVRPNPFLRTAWDALKWTAVKMFAKEMEEQLVKSARRLAKRAMSGKLTASQIRGLRR